MGKNVDFHIKCDFYLKIFSCSYSLVAKEVIFYSSLQSNFNVNIKSVFYIKSKKKNLIFSVFILIFVEDLVFFLCSVLLFFIRFLFLFLLIIFIFYLSLFCGQSNFNVIT